MSRDGGEPTERDDLVYTVCTEMGYWSRCPWDKRCDVEDVPKSNLSDCSRSPIPIYALRHDVCRLLWGKIRGESIETKPVVVITDTFVQPCPM